MARSVHGDAAVFRPKYELKMYLSLFGLLLFFVVSVFVAVKVGHREPLSYFIPVFFGLGFISMWAQFFRRIRFNSTIVIDRFLLPPRELSYSDVLYVGLSSMKTTRGRISTYFMTNNASVALC